jgi:CheY-like chemotaxis protein
MWFAPHQLVVCCDESEEDEFVFKLAAKKAGVYSRLQFFLDGSQAAAYFQKMTATAELPSVIFLRYQLPELSGDQLVRVIRQNAALNDVPIIYLTGVANDSPVPSADIPAGVTLTYESLITPETFSEVEELFRHIHRPM